MININMRCIEIFFYIMHTLLFLRLTLTWDVLKFSSVLSFISSEVWLTLTWDVLKFYRTVDDDELSPRLTLTWDVLK